MIKDRTRSVVTPLPVREDTTPPSNDRSRMIDPGQIPAGATVSCATGPKGQMCVTLRLPQADRAPHQAQQIKTLVLVYLATRYPGSLMPAGPGDTSHEHTIELDLSMLQNLRFDDTRLKLETALRVTHAFGDSTQVLETLLADADADLTHESECGLVIKGTNADRVGPITQLDVGKLHNFTRLCVAASSDPHLPQGAAQCSDLLMMALETTRDPEVYRALLSTLVKVLGNVTSDLSGPRLDRLARSVSTALTRLPTQDPLRDDLGEYRTRLLSQFCAGATMSPGLVMDLLESHVEQAIASTPPGEQGPCDDLIDSAVSHLYARCARSAAGSTTIDRLLGCLNSLPGSRAIALRESIDRLAMRFQASDERGLRCTDNEERALARLHQANVAPNFEWVGGQLAMQWHSALDPTKKVDFDPIHHTDLLLAYAQVCSLDLAPMVMRFLLGQTDFSAKAFVSTIEMALSIATATYSSNPLPVETRRSLIGACVAALATRDDPIINTQVWFTLSDRTLELNDLELVQKQMALQLTPDAIGWPQRLNLQVLQSQTARTMAEPVRVAIEQSAPVLHSLIELTVDTYAQILDKHLQTHGVQGESPTLRSLNDPANPADAGSMHLACDLWVRMCQLHATTHWKTNPALALAGPAGVDPKDLRSLPAADPLAGSRPTLGVLLSVLDEANPDISALKRLLGEIGTQVGVDGIAGGRALIEAANRAAQEQDGQRLLSAVVCLLQLSLQASPAAALDPNFQRVLGRSLDHLRRCGHSQMAAHLVVNLCRKTGWAPLRWQSPGGLPDHHEVARYLAWVINHHRDDFNQVDVNRALASCLCHPMEPVKVAQDSENNAMGGAVERGATALPDWWLQSLDRGGKDPLKAAVAINGLHAQVGSRESPLNDFHAHDAWRTPIYVDNNHVWANQGLSDVLVILGGMYVKDGEPSIYDLGRGGTPGHPSAGNDSNLLQVVMNEAPLAARADLIARWPAAKPFLVLGAVLSSVFGGKPPNHGPRQQVESALRALVAGLREPHFDDGTARPQELKDMQRAIADELMRMLDDWNR